MSTAFYASSGRGGASFKRGQTWSGSWGHQYAWQGMTWYSISFAEYGS